MLSLTDPMYNTNSKVVLRMMKHAEGVEEWMARHPSYQRVSESLIRRSNDVVRLGQYVHYLKYRLRKQDHFLEQMLEIRKMDHMGKMCAAFVQEVDRMQAHLDGTNPSYGCKTVDTYE